MPSAEKSPIKPFPRGGVPDWVTIALAFLVILASFLGGATPECGLPVQTTRMVAYLWESGGPRGLLQQDFSKAYTFTNP